MTDLECEIITTLETFRVSYFCNFGMNINDEKLKTSVDEE